jgi:hypothetical protein
MHAFMTVFVDELLWGETDGFRTVDHSRPMSDPERIFWLKVILLFWVGDYPGLGKVSAMKHAGAHGCHWCEGYFFNHSAGHNVCIHNRRNLRANHPFRKDVARWGSTEDRLPVPNRTHVGVEAKAQEIQDMPLGPERKKLQSRTGVDGYCLFMLLTMFDLVWDMLPDMMHITKGNIVHVYNALCYSLTSYL